MADRLSLRPTDSQASGLGGHSIGIASRLLRRNTRKSPLSTVITVCRVGGAERRDEAGIVMASSTEKPSREDKSDGPLILPAKSWNP